MRIVVDAMGGDYAPRNVVEGVAEALKELDVHITLVGIDERIEEEFKRFDLPHDRLEVIHAPEVVGMHEPAITPIRKKKDSSIAVGMSLLKNEDYDAFVSAGNTGAVVAAATFILGMLEGVERPAIGLVIPTLENFSFLIDVGANSSPKPVHLLQSALLAQVYAKEFIGIQDPTVGLINIGEEETKGSDFAKETHKLMDERIKNFIGNIEPNEVFSGKSDCIICDGFVGNVMIKVAEGIMESAGTLLKREVLKNPLAILGAFLVKSRLNRVKKLADYAEYGGAPLLGVNGIVMISHGRSSPKAIKNAIRATMREVEHNILAVMRREISQK